MKRRTSIRRICAAAAAALCLSVAALPSAARADALIEEFWFTMYDVDYYVVVDAPDGGVNLRYGAGTEYSKVLDGMIPNGTVLHIDAEARANNGKYWGATEYDGWSGFIFLGHTKKTAPPAETTAAETAAEEYYKSYHEWFDEVDWVQCVDYISRAIELVAKLGINDKKDKFLTEVYNDIVRLNGDDSSFLSISLIELIIKQKFCCDFSTLLPLVDKLISKNEGGISTAHIAEQAYYLKANLYKQLKDPTSENSVYVQYADVLMQRAENLVKAQNGEGTVDNRNWFMAENDIKKAIGLFQNHGAPEKAVNAQKRLVEIQKVAIKHIPMHEFKYDVSEYYKKFCTEYENHNIHELIWDVIFAFGFQNKQKIREDVTKNSSLNCTQEIRHNVLGQSHLIDK